MFFLERRTIRSLEWPGGLAQAALVRYCSRFLAWQGWDCQFIKFVPGDFVARRPNIQVSVVVWPDHRQFNVVELRLIYTKVRGLKFPAVIVTMVPPSLAVVEEAQERGLDVLFYKDLVNLADIALAARKRRQTSLANARPPQPVERK